MEFPTGFRTRSGNEGKPTVVTFIGAQVISAAIYFAMKRAGQAVYANLTYFNEPESAALAGQAGQWSH